MARRIHGRSGGGDSHPERPIVVATRLWAILLLASSTFWGCGDPFVEIWVRNDAPRALVVSIADENSGQAISYLAAPNATGSTFSGGGTFKGRIAIKDANTCETLAAMPATGGIFAVVIPTTGNPRIVGFDDAFPGPAPTKVFSVTTLCGG